MAARENLDLEIFVVDNASADDTLTMIKSEFPAVHVIANSGNVGFARANNQALSRCTGSYVLFLNPDTEIPAHTLQACVTFMESHPQVGAAGVRMLDGRGQFLRESLRGFPTPSASFWKLTGFAALFPRSRRFAGYYLGHLDPSHRQVIDVVSGAFFFARKAVLDHTGGFDERFFMYAEDIDLSARIQHAGYQNYYLPEVTILHHKGASTRKDARYVIQFYKAMSQFVHKHYGRGLYSATLDAGIWLRAGVSMIANRLRRKR